MEADGRRAQAPRRAVGFALAGTLCLGLTLAAHANFFGNAFHFDDSHVLEQNLYIRSLTNLPRFFVDARTFSSLPTNSTYRPLVSMSLALDYQVAVRAREIIADPECWLRGELAVTADRRSVDPTDVEAYRFCAVGAHSAALWFRGADTPSGAFDDAQDFDRHDLLRFARARTLYHVPVWIDVGRADPFLQADTALARELLAHGTHVRLVVHGGGHSGWSARIGEYVRFYARACT